MSRVARWHNFTPEAQILVIFRKSCYGRRRLYFRDIWSILQPFCILDGHLVYFVVIWNIFTRSGILYQEKSGSPVHEFKTRQKSSLN
jgi:hypothetical protein